MYKKLLIIDKFIKKKKELLNMTTLEIKRYQKIRAYFKNQFYFTNSTQVVQKVNMSGIINKNKTKVHVSEYVLTGNVYTYSNLMYKNIFIYRTYFKYNNYIKCLYTNINILIEEKYVKHRRYF